MLVAVGRTPRTDGPGLFAVGVERDDAGRVVVDARMRTPRPTIRAAGDVTPHPRCAHVAGVHADTAASDAVLGPRRCVSATVPRVTSTSPGLGAVGATQASATGRTASTIRHEDADRAVAEERTAGVTRIVVDRRDRILGGTSERAYRPCCG